MRSAIFDLDGTLAETAPDLIGAANVIAAEQGWATLDPVADRAIAGRGGRAMLRAARSRAMGRDEAEAVETAIPRFLEVYAGRIARESTLYPGAVACLDAFEAAGWRLGVCTNKPVGLAEALLAALGVADRFGAVLGADSLPVRKPDPEHLFETIRRVGGAPDRAVLIGDTITDRETARRAGAPCILVTFGYVAEPMQALAPEAVIDALAEAPEVAARLLAERGRR